MARETRKIQIDGYTYAIRQLGAVESRKLSVQFLQVAGAIIPGLVKALGGKLKPEDAGTVSEEALGELVGLLQDIDPDKLEPLWNAFAANGVALNGTQTITLADQFDEHFAGDMQFAMWRFFIESAKVNFGGFLAKALGKANASASGPATATS